MSMHHDTAGLFTQWTRVLAAGLGFVALFLLYLPIVGLATLSFSGDPLSGIPWPLTFKWYGELFARGNSMWIDPLLTSLGVGLVVSLFTTSVALLVGRVLPVVRNRGGLLAGYFAVLVLPGILLGIAIMMFYRGLLGIRTGLWSIVLAHFVWALPFSLLCILIVSVRFDRRLLEAAKDLGANRWRQLLDIELPLLTPGIAASLFFSFLLSFNELPRTMYVRGSIITLPYYVWTASASHSSQVPLIYALSAMIMFASFVLVLMAMRILARQI